MAAFQEITGRSSSGPFRHPKNVRMSPKPEIIFVGSPLAGILHSVQKMRSFPRGGLGASSWLAGLERRSDLSEAVTLVPKRVRERPNDLPHLQAFDVLDRAGFGRRLRSIVLRCRAIGFRRLNS